jgi:multidrug resistance efflux pump
VESPKTPLTISTYTVGKTQSGVTIEKAGRITASSSLTLTAQWAWEISKIYVKEGQSVKAGAVIATLKDTQNNYDLRYQQAVNTLKVQSASIDTSRINLEQAVDNARVAYERARQTYETLTNKNALSYDTIVNSNKKTLDSYNESYQTYLSETERLMTQMLYEGDRILGMTNSFKYSVDGWKPYLGIQVGNSRAESENQWNNTYSIRGDIRARIEKKISLSPTSITNDLDLITRSYAQIRTYADAMIYMLQNNVIGGGLGQDMSNGWLATWNGLRSQIQWSEWGFNGWKSQTLTFFRGYQNSETASRLALISLSRELTPDEKTLVSSGDARVTYENAKIDLKDKVENARLSYEQTKESYNSAQELRRATIIQLDANRENAKIALEQAERDASKLRVTAPVDGVIARVIGNVWQSVNIGSQIADFTGREPQIVLDVAPTLASGLSVGQSVSIAIDAKSLTGIISAVSSVTNSNLLSTIRISVAKWQNYIGKSAQIVFVPQSTVTQPSILTLPLDAVSIIAEGEWEIRIYTATGITREHVMIGQTLGDTIEIKTLLPSGTEVILTDLSNYDPAKQILTKK